MVLYKNICVITFSNDLYLRFVAIHKEKQAKQQTPSRNKLHHDETPDLHVRIVDVPAIFYIIYICTFSYISLHTMFIINKINITGFNRLLITYVKSIRICFFSLITNTIYVTYFWCEQYFAHPFFYFTLCIHSHTLYSYLDWNTHIGDVCISYDNGNNKPI